MGQRPTRRAGIAKYRGSDPQTQIMLDAIVERIEVLDGIRGDSLDKAVTYRDLGDSGFTVVPGAGGTQQITNTPGSGTSGGVEIPGVGVAAAPENLAAAETFLALLLTWTNPSFNLQHIEVWRSATNNLSTALLLGTTVAPQFADYVGANATYYYWVRSVGTDGTYSAYNDTEGTEGTTGIDPSFISIPGGGFEIQDPGVGPDITPFIVGTVGGETAVGLSGQFIVDGTIRAESIIANSIGADRIAAMQLSAISGDMGVLRAGRITTGTDGTPPAYDNQSAFRVELESQASTEYPLWYGSDAKGATTGLFYVDKNGRVVVRGVLDSSIIRQSLFMPSGDLDSFRIATEYVDDGNPGANYTGKQAHLFPMKAGSVTDQSLQGYRISPMPANPGFWVGKTLQFVSPEESSSTTYGRLGTYSEMFMIQMAAGGERGPGAGSTNVSSKLEVVLQYQYDSDGWNSAFEATVGAADQSGAWTQIFVSRDDPTWDRLTFRVRVSTPETWKLWHVRYITLSAWTPNFGYADAGLVLQPPNDSTDVNDLPDFPEYKGSP